MHGCLKFYFIYMQTSIKKNKSGRHSHREEITFVLAFCASTMYKMPLECHIVLILLENDSNCRLMGLCSIFICLLNQFPIKVKNKENTSLMYVTCN